MSLSASSVSVFIQSFGMTQKRKPFVLVLPNAVNNIANTINGKIRHWMENAILEISNLSVLFC